MKRMLLSLTGLVVLASCAAKTDSVTEANNYNTYKYIETETAHDLKVKYDEIQANMAKIEQEKANKRTVSSPVKKTAKIEDRTDYEIYTVTSYTNGYESTQKHKGDKGYAITSSGVHTKEGVTVSADTRKLPIGTKIFIEGYGERIVQDTGGAIKNNRLDLFIEDLDEAKAFGKKKLKVWIVSKPKEGE